MSERVETRRAGRPRSFQEEEALDQAMRVFWAQGFEGASINDLVGAMGMKPASIYSAFGNKEALFAKALDRYLSGPLAYMRFALDAPTAYKVVDGILRGTAEFLACPSHPAGCLTVQTSLACGAEAQPVHASLAGLRREWQESLRLRLDRAKADGDLPRDENPSDLALYIAAVVHGMAVQSAGGAALDELLRVANTALRAWPKNRSRGHRLRSSLLVRAERSSVLNGFTT